MFGGPGCQGYKGRLRPGPYDPWSGRREFYNNHSDSTMEMLPNVYIDEPRKQKVLGRTNVLEASPSEGPQALPRSGVRVTYKKGLRRITLQRYLASRLAHEPEAVTFAEILVLYDNLIWLLEKAIIDPDFRRVFSEDLESLADLLRKTVISESTFKSSLQGLSLGIRTRCSGFLLPKRNLAGVARHVSGHFHVLPYRGDGIPTKELRPKAYIGVGYKDKGSRRDPAYDGSPSWQEVAMSHVEDDND